VTTNQDQTILSNACTINILNGASGSVNHTSKSENDSRLWHRFYDRHGCHNLFTVQANGVTIPREY